MKAKIRWIVWLHLISSFLTHSITLVDTPITAANQNWPQVFTFYPCISPAETPLFYLFCEESYYCLFFPSYQNQITPLWLAEMTLFLGKLLGLSSRTLSLYHHYYHRKKPTNKQKHIHVCTSFRFCHVNRD